MKLSDHCFDLKIGDDGLYIHLALFYYEDHLILVDTGYAGQLPQIQEAIEYEGFSLQDLKTIILTHQDHDHIGNAKALRQKTGAKICCFEAEAPYINGTLIPEKIAALANRPHLSSVEEERLAMLKETYEEIKVPVDELLQDGQVIEGLKVIATPGHTAGHICLYHPSEQILVAGDALGAANKKLTGPNPVYTADKPLAYQSLAKLLDYPIEIVITAHGGIVKGDIHPQLQALINASLAAGTLGH
ncbi:MAG: MBL fold metallo-hydrolase [Erysipelotrichaceae bacterium]|jgi:glyoxylase-like metal-dependent hydrolase (beta-lactamase superfamily II)|nr:MBL fold metallo-hydrolase [Erysipelotrichaceae bacterium]